MSATLAAPFSGSRKHAAVTADELFYTTIHARNIGLVRKLLDVVLPVAYSEDFYRKLQEAPPELAKLGALR